MYIGVCIYIFRCQISVIQDFKNQNFNYIAIFAINRKLIIEMTCFQWSVFVTPYVVIVHATFICPSVSPKHLLKEFDLELININQYVQITIFVIQNFCESQRGKSAQSQWPFYLAQREIWKMYYSIGIIIKRIIVSVSTHETTSHETTSGLAFIS